MKYGWLPDVGDIRDFSYQAPRSILRKLPQSVDLRNSNMPLIWDQGDLGSCTAHAIGAAFEYQERQEQAEDFVPSRLFIYYNERKMEGTVNSDSGAMIRDGIKSLNIYGTCPEDMWPYDIPKFRNKPTTKCYQIAQRHQAMSYSRVARLLTQMKGCLSDGYPFVFGFSVYESFESRSVAKTGMVPMPKTGEQQLGGHAVMACGYNDNTARFLVRNSWGPKWGQSGYFWMPYGYLLNPDLSDDFWTVRLVEK